MLKVTGIELQEAKENKNSHPSDVKFGAPRLSGSRQTLMPTFDESKQHGMQRSMQNRQQIKSQESGEKKNSLPSFTE